MVFGRREYIEVAHFQIFSQNLRESACSSRLEAGVLPLTLLVIFERYDAYDQQRLNPCTFHLVVNERAGIWLFKQNRIRWKRIKISCPNP